YTSTFQNSTHRTSGYYTGTMSSRFDQYFGSAFFSPLVMRNSTMHYRNLDQVLFRIFNSFGNSFLHFFCFSQTMSYNSITITNNYQCRETECTTTFGCLN